MLVDDLHYPEMALARTGVSNPIRAEVKDNYLDYLGTLRPGFPGPSPSWPSGA